MSIFGWSLPPGCGKLPGEEDSFCEVCGRNEDNCICPECAVCGEVGRLQCYNISDCGQNRTAEQLRSYADEQAKQAERDRIEYEADLKYNQDNPDNPD